MQVRSEVRGAFGTAVARDEVAFGAQTAFLHEVPGEVREREGDREGAAAFAHQVMPGQRVIRSCWTGQPKMYVP